LPLLQHETCALRRLLGLPFRFSLPFCHPPPLVFALPQDCTVVLLATACIRQHLVRLLQALELLVRASFVRVLVLGPLPVRLPDTGGSRVLLQAQHIVVCARVHLQGWKDGHPQKRDRSEAYCHGGVG
jgi:hypothetical protein